MKRLITICAVIATGIVLTSSQAIFAATLSGTLSDNTGWVTQQHFGPEVVSAGTSAAPFIIEGTVDISNVLGGGIFEVGLVDKEEYDTYTGLSASNYLFNNGAYAMFYISGGQATSKLGDFNERSGWRPNDTDPDRRRDPSFGTSANMDPGSTSIKFVLEIWSDVHIRTSTTSTWPANNNQWEMAGRTRLSLYDNTDTLIDSGEWTYGLRDNDDDQRLYYSGLLSDPLPWTGRELESGAHAFVQMWAGANSTASYSVNYIPEPATIGLLGFGGLALLRRNRGYGA